MELQRRVLQGKRLVADTLEFRPTLDLASDRPAPYEEMGMCTALKGREAAKESWLLRRCQR